HLVSNFSVILLIGPILEKQLGWQKLLLISVVTTIAIGVVHVVFSDSGLIGASGLVFLYIVLVSLSNSNDKEIPLTFILVVILFLGQEVLASFNIDNISHLAHIGGGVMAILFKYVFRNV
ncbi:MAG TPA: rhomboid family intramembrane serine protease, partial [Taishania sp.]|nr:rhomboid family intramembrane serine protease [Taishania sp.]